MTTFLSAPPIAAAKTEFVVEHTVNGVPLRVYSSGRITRTDTGRDPKPSDNGLGYQRIRINNKRVMVHRIVWEAFYGRVTPGFQIDHIDHDKSNNDMDNLQLVSASENTQRYHNLRRSLGVAHKRSASKPVGRDAAIAIRSAAMAGVPRSSLAAQYGVCVGAIRHIISGRNYKN